ncbi:hypothetical protein L687_16900 [Microbacterium maritypicum MF109]|uniref:Phage portal protein n=2 Tax=Microbacterium maritypicum TaxID=33918 RepID=T5KJK4_MICMQ|nr:hypothetical protein L687_16900 [Microbacterium maritypicum MF109]
MQLTLDAYKGDEPIEKPLLLRRPDSDESLSASLERTSLSLCLNGNAFWRVFRDNQGRVTGIRVLNPLDVKIEVDSFGNVTGYTYLGRKYDTTEIKHLSHLRVFGQPEGRGPIQACHAELRGALDVRDHGANWFQDSGVPTGILSSKTPLNAENAEKAKARWIETQGGHRGPAILDGDWSWQSVYLSPEDAQWLQVRQFDNTAIARLFGIPAVLMLAAVEGSSETYANIGQAETTFAKYTLTRYLREIEEAFSDLLPRGTVARFNLEGLLRPDATTRYALHTQALTAGFMSVNEVRSIENLPPIPGGDHKTQAELDAQAEQFEQTDETAAPDQEEEASDE